MVDYDFSPETLEQLDAIYRDAAKYGFATKEEFEREFMGMHPDELGTAIGVWQRGTNAFLLYRKRHEDGQELEDSKAVRILSAFSGLILVNYTDDADEIREALIDFDALPEDERQKVMSCLLKVSEASKVDKENEMSDSEKDGLERCWADLHLGVLESLRTPPSSAHSSGRRKKRTKRGSRK